MISIIVPVFNAEGTLRRCIDSILSQTNPDLEVLLIDDGSTDGSSIIMDDYAAADSRVKMLHKENGGLSSARNYGLDRARGEYILFVDADDWIEPTACDLLMKEAGRADLCVFGRSVDSPAGKRKWMPADKPEWIGPNEAIRRLVVEGTIRHAVWDKLYRRELFDDIRFPEGYNYEDLRITYKLLQQAQNIVLIPDVLYHHVQYDGSISNTQSAKNRLDYWTACYELYRVFKESGEAYREACARRCMYSAGSAWASLWRTDRAEREREQERIREIVRFAREHENDAAKYNLRLRAAVALAATGTRWSMLCGYSAIRLRRLFKKENQLFPRASGADGGSF